ncbi:LysR family transcriptional regulator [Halobacillus sp. HZG1]|uniref:LysR family transcriptional regulator n=1 Tax=Halobacillus sp. HZG1 TaxID=3111769 RepID=UPI002DB5AF76|nr:LysR family transcriptional regulator [Halobacillus sp. HZG1]MEC3883374.1 LysR family transcriptional regulator [Halobacillus sp. HZG1]
MDLKSLKTFKLIASTGSFQRASEELNYAQSTVTMQIKKLEEDLGVKLFERGKRIGLTDAGRVLLEEATPLLFSAETVRQKMVSYEKGEAGTIRMGSIEPAASLILPSVIFPFLDERPQVQFELEVGNTKNISQLVAKGELDFAISAPPSIEENLVFTSWFEETLGLLLPEDHALREKKTIKVSDLHGERLIYPGQNHTCRSLLETELMKYGNTLYSGISIGSTETLKKAVKQNLGIAIVPVTTSERDLEGTQLREIEDMQLSYPIGLIQRKDQLHGSLMTKLIKALESELTSWKRAW